MWVPAATNNKTESHGQQQKDNEQTGNIHGTCLCIPVLFPDNRSVLSGNFHVELRFQDV
jgi:hypothetical protein